MQRRLLEGRRGSGAGAVCWIDSAALAFGAVALVATLVWVGQASTTQPALLVELRRAQALDSSVCPEFQNIYVESLPEPPKRLDSAWKDAAVKPRTWVEPCPYSRYCASNVSYVHSPVGQDQASIRDSFCDFQNMTDVFGGAWTTYAISGDMRRTPPLVKPLVGLQDFTSILNPAPLTSVLLKGQPAPAEPKCICWMKLMNSNACAVR